MSGVSVSADPELARLFGVSTDSLGQLQANNVTLFPGQTNRPGIFAVGPCRGQPYPPRIRSEADATALSVHSLLSPGHLVVELSQPVVDPDKCVLCLTCVRSCPHKAMVVDRQKGAAASSPEACQRCGICAGECPARAIELPAYSDKVLLSMIG
jgi:heterodisulfide reductase subunit A-like polyferredoxin